MHLEKINTDCRDRLWDESCQSFLATSHITVEHPSDDATLSLKLFGKMVKQYSACCRFHGRRAGNVLAVWIRALAQAS